MNQYIKHIPKRTFHRKKGLLIKKIEEEKN
jgi:hypothetical protein